jgi:hypothetical protein
MISPVLTCTTLGGSRLFRKVQRIVFRLAMFIISGKAFSVTN